MKLGFSTLFFSGGIDAGLYPCFERLKEWGYDGVELPVVGASEAELDAARRVLEGLELECTAVGFATPEADPISADAAVREAARTHLGRCVDNAERLGARLLAGPIHSAYAQFSGAGPTSDERARCAEVLRAVAEHAGAKEMRVGVEFLNRFECYFATTAAETDAVVKLADHPALCTVYDTHPRSARPGTGALGGDLLDAARDRLRRLAGGGVLLPDRPRARWDAEDLARPCGRLRGRGTSCR